MARQQPKHLVGHGEFAIDCACISIISAGGFNLICEKTEMVLLSQQLDVGCPLSGYSIPTYPFHAASVVNGKALITIVKTVGTYPEVAPSVVQSVSVYVVRFHAFRGASYDPVHVEIATPVAHPPVGHCIDRMCSNYGVPLELVDALKVFVVNDGDVAFCEGDCFHAGEWKRPAPGIEAFEAGGASRILAKSDVVFNAPLSYHNQPGSQVFTE